ncbi:glutamate-5-semialdehyde dehydrogenase [Membranihabitans marinus]|uniref:glutamate-5-semialdehyde dehydrogenase n=1 Tax=Membranihabitans marinus TaxID=1227546 RepID=UPI001F0244FF|nr:glutamate-5-semialdehyde dehydrogenase [Membranihabitans marinus]
MKLLDTTTKNNVLQSMMAQLDKKRAVILAANQKDLDAFDPEDRAMYDRLIIDDKKIDTMIKSVQEVHDQADPVGMVKSKTNLDNGLEIINKTSPFGTIMIIYESRPDVTIEAAVLAFKANSKILLKGGKEAINSNLALVDCWQEALSENNLDKDWIQYLNFNRTATQEFLKNPNQPIDLIVPRGGERLIAFVKEHATCPVLVSGRGNNFVYVDKDADWEQSKKVILNAKTDKISACNALDKILIDKSIPNFSDKIIELQEILAKENVEILVDSNVKEILKDQPSLEDESVWYEEFLALKGVIGAVDSMEEAIDKINQYSGGHSSIIMTTQQDRALAFMEQVDSAAVYMNASSRFTDGGQMGVGAELAISTDKLHHRGPLGLEQLVTNKYYVFGNGQIRK